MKNQSGIAHFFLIFLLAIGLIAALVLLNQRTTFLPRASSDKNLIHEEITDSTNQLIHLLDNNSAEALEIAKSRARNLEDIAVSSPTDFLKFATLINHQRLVSEELASYIEQEIELKGKLNSTVVEDFQTGEERIFYNVKTDDKIYSLILPEDFKKDLNTGSKITIKGISIGSLVVIGDSGDVNQPDNYEVVDEPKAFGSKIAVVLWQKEGANDTNSYSRDEIADYMFGDSDSVKDFYRKNSGEKINLSGNVFGPYTLNENVAQDICLSSDSRYPTYNAAEAIRKTLLPVLQQESVSMSDYDNLIVIPTSNVSCASARNTSRVTAIDLPLTIIANPFLSDDKNKKNNFLWIISHELGHHMNLFHAEAYHCKFFNGTTFFNFDSSCAYDPVGLTSDSSDVMSYAYDVENIQKPHYFNAPHKIELGWIDQSKIQTVIQATITQNGIYTIQSLESTRDDNYKVLIIPNIGKVIPLNKNYPNFREISYYLSFRNLSGYNLDMFSTYNQGLNLHYAYSDLSKFNGDNGLTKIIYANPTVSGAKFRLPYDSVFVDNLSMYDPINKIVITQLSHTSDTVTVMIEFNK